MRWNLNLLRMSKFRTQIPKWGEISFAFHVFQLLSIMATKIITTSPSPPPTVYGVYIIVYIKSVGGVLVVVKQAHSIYDYL